MITFIAQNAGSLALRQFVKTVLVNKYRKYTEPESKGASGKAPKHEHVGRGREISL